MDDFYADDFSDNFNPKGWTEKDWFLYLKKSDAEITRFAGIYTVNRLRGKTLEEKAFRTPKACNCAVPGGGD